ncbi:hypothetical protein E2C01_060820 [Portunus trituberculatus]|uniref:Uncharacterized protein n=1 Tax=Portunus trituberculatus TaxID=210409 RepID=A0A5B7HA32_PORTR|nr:hypothetical protein [Portunus trituberculatus]
MTARHNLNTHKKWKAGPPSELVSRQLGVSHAKVRISVVSPQPLTSIRIHAADLPTVPHGS